MNRWKSDKQKQKQSYSYKTPSTLQRDTIFPWMKRRPEALLEHFLMHKGQHVLPHSRNCVWTEIPTSSFSVVPILSTNKSNQTNKQNKKKRLTSYLNMVQKNIPPCTPVPLESANIPIFVFLLLLETKRGNIHTSPST